MSFVSPNCGVRVGRWCQLEGPLPGRRRPLEEKLLFRSRGEWGSLEDLSLEPLGVWFAGGHFLTFGKHGHSQLSPLTFEEVAGVGEGFLSPSPT